MELLRWKTRIAVLWVVLAVNFSAYIFVGLIRSEAIKELLENPSSATADSTILILFLIPFILAWLSLTLKDSANRWVNLVLGILHVVFFVVQLIQQASAGISSALFINIAFALVVSILIAWYAWKWPKQEA